MPPKKVPPKKGGNSLNKKDAKGQINLDDPEEMRKQFRKFLKLYQTNCEALSVTPIVSMIQRVTKMIKSEEDPTKLVFPIVVDEEITHNGLKALLETLNNYPHYDQINLWKTAIGDEGIVFLGSWIKPNPYLKILDLMDNRIGLEGCRSLSMALQHNECLTTLILDYNEIGDAGAQILSFGVSWNPVLQVISLQYCGISEIGGSAIGNEVVAKSQSLRSLDLQGNPLGPGGVASIAYGLTQTRTLETLSLVDTSFGYDSHCLMQLAKGLEENKTLTSLNLNLNTLDAEGAVMLVSAIKATPSLTKVRIYEKMDSAMFKQFIDAIKANKIKASKKKKKGKRKGGKKKKGAKGKKK